MNPVKKVLVKYGKSFNSERDADAYGKMMAEKRARSSVRRSSMTNDEKERESIRRHFSKESKHFNV